MPSSRQGTENTGVNKFQDFYLHGVYILVGKSGNKILYDNTHTHNPYLLTNWMLGIIRV